VCGGGGGGGGGGGEGSRSKESEHVLTMKTHTDTPWKRTTEFSSH